MCRKRWPTASSHAPGSADEGHGLPFLELVGLQTLPALPRTLVMPLRSLPSLHCMGEVTNSEQDSGLSVKCRTTLPAQCRSLAEQAVPRILQRSCPLLVNWMIEDRYCCSIFRSQIVCPKEKSSVFSRPESSLCSLGTSLAD